MKPGSEAEARFLNLECIDASETSLSFMWNPIKEAKTYELQWKYAKATAQWKPVGSGVHPVFLWEGLPSDTAFDLRVRGFVGNSWCLWSHIKSFSTLARGILQLAPVKLISAEKEALTVEVRDVFLASFMPLLRSLRRFRNFLFTFFFCVYSGRIVRESTSRTSCRFEKPPRLHGLTWGK